MIQWTPTPYRPPMLANTPNLGVASAAAAAAVWPWIWRLGIPLLVGAGIVAASGALVKSAVPTLPVDTARIPTAAILGGAGAAAYYGTDLLPDAWKPLGYIAAVAGVTGSIYWLFSGIPQEPGVAPQTARNPIPDVPPEVLRRMFALTFDPAQPFTGGSSRSLMKEQTYQFQAFNRGSGPIGFFSGLLILDSDLKPIFRTPPVDKGNPDYGRQEFHIVNGGWTEGSIKHPALGLSNWGFNNVEIEIFRRRDDVEPVMRSQTIPITYAPVG